MYLLWPFFSLVFLFTFYAMTTDFTDVQYDAEGNEIVTPTTWVDILNMINAVLLIA